MRPRREAWMLGALWPGLGQLALGRRRTGLVLSLGALGLVQAFLLTSAPVGLLGWAGLWVWGMSDLLLVLVVGPARRERAERLMRAGIAYLLRGDLPRSSDALGRAVSIGGPVASGLYLAEAERLQGRSRRASHVLSGMEGSPRAEGWRWEIDRARSRASMKEVSHGG